MRLSDDKLQEIVLSSRLISPEELVLQAKEAVAQNVPLYDYLVQKEIIDERQFARILADYYGFNFIDLTKVSIADEILNTIPEIVAKKQKIIAFQKDAKGLHLAMADPTDLEIIEFVKKKSGQPVIPYLSAEKDINGTIVLYAKNVANVFEEIMVQNVPKVRGTKTGEEVEAPIIKIVDTVITYAFRNKSSDIHIEPLKNECLVRFRIDGILHDIIKFPLKFHPQIVTRIKVMSRLRTDEHQMPQDGKIQFMGEDATVDIRVSILPTVTGEKIVMRLLADSSRRLSLTDLGFSKADLEKVKEAYHKPYGMILATGPTGCGKTTTMYAILKLLNRREINITTIEDPVEYDLPGVNQIQVNVKSGLTFAKGLRSIVRQDPNVILVGEIRDEETASIAINSAMTGHLVLSTLHTNDAATAIPRLLDMGIEPFLVASSVNVVVAQRLVRRICEKCRVSEEVLSEKPDVRNETENVEADVKEKDRFELIQKYLLDHQITRLYRGKGCPVCSNTGYVGRLGIFEVLFVDDEVRRAIVERKDAAEIRQIAVKKGMVLMIDDGIEKVKQGLTTIEEIVRVTKE